MALWAVIEQWLNGTVTMEIQVCVMEAPTYADAIMRLKQLPLMAQAQILREDDVGLIFTIPQRAETGATHHGFLRNAPVEVVGV